MTKLAILCLSILAFATLAQMPVARISKTGLEASFRGLSVVDDGVAWVSGSKGTVGISRDAGRTWRFVKPRGYETLDFRSLYAFDSLTAVIANAGSPAFILKTIDGGRTWSTQYKNEHKDIFLDGIDFWNRNHGLVYGDPMEGRMVLLETKDGGNTWTELQANQRPSLIEGEASFAASGTGIRCFKNKVMVATGGMESRLWLAEKGKWDWKPLTVPIAKGKNSSGIFTVVTQPGVWLVGGGDYVADSIRVNNAFISRDGGKSWKAPTQTVRGHVSGMDAIANTKFIACGQFGIDYSHDTGNTWRPISNEKSLWTIRKARKGNLILAAGRGKIVRIEYKP